LDERLTALAKECHTELEKQGFVPEQIHTEVYLHMRYEGTDCALMCTVSPNSEDKTACKHGDFQKTFLER
jgi:N-methylhydantoinase A/acetone carboxylase, beta subunit